MSSFFYCNNCKGYYNPNSTVVHTCTTASVGTVPSTETYWYPTNAALDAKLDKITELLKAILKSTTPEAILEQWDGILEKINPETGFLRDEFRVSTHKYPVGEKVRLINGNGRGQWGTVAQHLLNGQYLVENTWLTESPDKDELSDATYQVLAEHLILPLEALLTVSDLKVGDTVKYLDGVYNYHKSASGAFTVTAVGEKSVLLSGEDYDGEVVEFSTDPSDLELVQGEN